ncbi:MAG TPA: chorismate mutase [Vicinamibacterales bacterium]|nr:chorismate mutase [Vicinamibacterales bacterium]
MWTGDRFLDAARAPARDEPSPRAILGVAVRGPLIVAGPCSAESEEQVLRTARQIAALGRVGIFRAGVWKPRTRPGQFEGVGAPALEWLKSARAETGLPFAVEVGNARHVEAALGAAADVVWIGARTTANPFAVQELADALRGADTPVAVKNPVNPDVQVWVGAVERLTRASITRLAAIHRGFSTYGARDYRHSPMWEIALEFRRRLPDVPLICDPSHICGRTETLAHVARTALDLEYAGLMIETHCDPSAALSDAGQQITPGGLRLLLDRVASDSGDTRPHAAAGALEALRENIDALDEALLDVLARRMEVARAIGRYKRETRMAIRQDDRWHRLMVARIASGANRQLSSRCVRRLFETIHDESIREQQAIAPAPPAVDRIGMGEAAADVSARAPRFRDPRAPAAP